LKTLKVILYPALKFETPSSQRILGGMEMTTEDMDFDDVVTASLYCN
jgi:hypothetical protein